MKTTVKLQAPFSYAKLPIIILILVLIMGILFYVAYYVYIKNKSSMPTQIKKDIPKDIEKIKKKYLKILEAIQKDMLNQKIDTRQSYIRMSECIRRFVYEATGIKAPNCTLEDVRSLGIPALLQLMEEYYTPEFARESVGDCIASFDRTRNAIENWK